MGWRQERPDLAREVQYLEEALRKATDNIESGIRSLDQGDFDATNVIGLTDEYTARIARHAAAITRRLREEG